MTIEAKRTRPAGRMCDWPLCDRPAKWAYPDEKLAVCDRQDHIAWMRADVGMGARVESVK